jgi:protein-S-isoprenylcysteine O-methyltransferase Ste14
MKPETSSRLRYLGALAPLLYLETASLCLRQWRSGDPWSKVDAYCGGFFILNTLLILYQFAFNRSILRQSEVLREASGSSYDSRTVMLGPVQVAFDLSVFLYYGHGPAVSLLASRRLRGLGLGAYGLGVLFLLWTDTRLMHHFAGGLANRELMTTGPYGIVRHPRYASLLLAKLGFALIFANVLGWASLAFSCFLAQRRIRLEEPHLRKLFGEEYTRYSRRTSRLLPRLY